MESVQISDALLQYADLIAKNRANGVPAAKTIEAKIIDVVDEGQGIYKVEYKSNNFEAMSSSKDITYSIDEIVYVLIPDGDFDKNKLILSPVTEKTTTYTSTIDTPTRIPIDDNLFTVEPEIIELSTYKSEEIKIKTTKEKEEDKYILKAENFKHCFSNSLKDSRWLNFTCRIKTNIDKERRTGGNYGLILSIPMLQKTINNETKKAIDYTITLDINNIIGDPYNFMSYALQNYYIEIPKDMEYDTSPDKNLILKVFVKDFPQDSSTPTDIWIKDIGLIPVISLDKEITTGYYLTLNASNGSAFLPNDPKTNKTITPTVLLNGKTTQIKNFNCYWFKENNAVDTSHEKFFKLGGLGWEILNDKTNIEIGEDGRETFQYITNVYKLEVQKIEVHCSTRYKCVLVRNNQVISQIIEIRNLDSSAEVYLESASGSNTYTQNVGKVRLVVRYYEKNVTDTDSANVIYTWQRFDKSGNYIDNNFFTIDRINEKVTTGEGQNKKTWYETEISYFTSLIDEFNIITCTVSIQQTQNEQVIKNIIATKSIMITTGDASTYKIKIENGDKLYKYDADGDSPRVANYDGPLTSVVETIEPIHIRLYKPDGSEFTDDEYAVTMVEWQVPKKSLIKPSPTGQSFSNENYYIYKGLYKDYNNLEYDIYPSFSENRLDNTIIIKAQYGNNIIENTTNINFLKDGQGGTNGSKFSAIIKYNGYVYGGNNNKLQLIYIKEDDVNKTNNNTWYIYNPAAKKRVIFKNDSTTTDTKLREFTLELYCNGEKISNYTPAVTWKIFDTEVEDYYEIFSPININQTTGIISLKDNIEWKSSSDNYCATIEAICRCQDPNDTSTTETEEYVYAYYPIEATYVQKESYLTGMVPTIEEGYNQVVYASDGTNPKYDNTYGGKFKLVDGLYNTDIANTYKYTWSGSANLTKSGSNSEPERQQFIPKPKFDNGAAKNYVKAIIEMDVNLCKKLLTLINNIQIKYNENLHYYNYYRELQGWDIKDNNGKVIGRHEGAIEILKKFNYNIYKQDLQNAKSIYKLKTELIKIDNDLMSTLNQIVSQCKTYKINYSIIIDSNKKTGKIQDLLNLLSKLYLIGIDSKVKDEVTKPDDLKFTQDQINGLIGQITDITTTSNKEGNKSSILRKSLENYNKQVENTYKNKYNELQKIEDINILEAIGKVQNNIQTYLQYPSWNILTEGFTDSYSRTKYEYDEEEQKIKTTKITYNIPASQEVYKYAKLKDNLDAYAESMKKSGTYSYSKTINNVLNPIRDALTAFKDINYQTEIDKYEKLKNDKLKEYKGYESKANESISIIHIKPIIMLFNRYEMSNINGWDGNKTQVDDGYILTPQIGAGKKEEDNTFTGLVMGVRQVKVNTSKNQKIGLFGYNKGIQSLFLNARDGSATFGMSGAGQIIIDPSKNAIIKSGNYNDSNSTTIYIRDNRTNINPKSKGLYEYNSITNQYILTKDEEVQKGKSYFEKTTDKGGMQINFSKPEIKFGSGKFSVDSDGNLHAGGAGDKVGDVGGWNIYDTSLQSANYKNNKGICLDAATNEIIFGSSGGKIYSGDHSALTRVTDGFYLSYNGLSIGNGIRITNKKDEKDNLISKIEVGRLTSSGKYWTIDGNSTYAYIAYGNNKKKSFNLQQYQSGYTRANVIYFYTKKDPNPDDPNDYARSGDIYLGTDGIRLGTEFAVDKSGILRTSSGTIGNWLITNNSIESINYDSKEKTKTYEITKTTVNIEDYNPHTNNCYTYNSENKNYTLTEDTSINTKKTYYQFTLVDHSKYKPEYDKEGKIIKYKTKPTEKEWYEYNNNNNKYKITSDTKIKVEDPVKDYYTRIKVKIKENTVVNTITKTIIVEPSTKKIKLDYNGNISCVSTNTNKTETKDWSIKNDGTAIFNDVIITGGEIKNYTSIKLGSNAMNEDGMDFNIGYISTGINFDGVSGANTLGTAFDQIQSNINTVNEIATNALTVANDALPATEFNKINIAGELYDYSLHLNDITIVSKAQFSEDVWIDNVTLKDYIKANAPQPIIEE